jgi:hypothetical protein
MDYAVHGLCSINYSQCVLSYGVYRVIAHSVFSHMECIYTVLSLTVCSLMHPAGYCPSVSGTTPFDESLVGRIANDPRWKPARPPRHD